MATDFSATLKDLNNQDTITVNNDICKRLVDKYKDPILENVDLDVLMDIEYIDIMYNKCQYADMMIACRNRLLGVLKKDDRLANVLELMAKEKGVLKEYKSR